MAKAASAWSMQENDPTKNVEGQSPQETPPLASTRQQSPGQRIDEAMTTWLFGGRDGNQNGSAVNQATGGGGGGGGNGLDAAVEGMVRGVQERGEALDQLGEKTERLKDISSQFEQMARELNQKNRSW
eukprot:CAMPEP_0194571154 /NCGR_PEP_ID=MMETSP0292-20121207/8216_1 /TAXON_ID=39354 /ORGANISM="Heterosigma akashiwo, Strain CCMP2393" /LENGTH=127 /DNA_ID=CAMNT_0039421813 /DNA_START=47 /DNA_END=427 /DNA_ORIENTATION=+